ncbi:hypothetical protein [Agrilutibacter solisilvae]|uniref:Uncharacterized protein n=1 Tax=Agrilutibacter solisilvae TaxID=2763317 RepID=A0A975ASY5_9GAMM|nr:hypothetical protein [Lysobacter solisilvae]QSX79459.1 hypothetical protein I8J32_006245 [Lysobacter solisilvae]
MTLSNADLMLMTYLDAVERGQGLPDGCDWRALLAEELLWGDKAHWALTRQGRLRLTDLRSVASESA